MARRKMPPPPPPKKRRWWKAWVAGVVVLGVAALAFRLARPEEFDYQAEQVRSGNGARGEPCDRLPPAEEVQAAVSAAADTVAAIAAVDGEGGSWLQVDTFRCPGKADLRVYHANVAQFRTIRRILGGSPLDGIPVRWTNT